MSDQIPQALRDILAAKEKLMQDEGYQRHDHVVSPAAMEAGGWGRCVECGIPVWLGEAS